MKNIARHIINIISSILFFGVFFVMDLVTASSNIFSSQNVLLVVISIVVYCTYIELSEKLLNYIDVRLAVKQKESNKDKLIGKFVDDVMEYCTSININPSMNFNNEGNLEIVDINKDNKKVIDFTIPEERELSEKNYNLHLEHIKDLINKANESEV